MGVGSTVKSLITKGNKSNIGWPNKKIDRWLICKEKIGCVIKKWCVFVWINMQEDATGLLMRVGGCRYGTLAIISL